VPILRNLHFLEQVKLTPLHKQAWKLSNGNIEEHVWKLAMKVGGILLDNAEITE